MYKPKNLLVPKSGTSKISGPQVAVVVGGEERHVVTIHQAILIKSSKFFAKAMRSEWKDLRGDASIELTHIDLYTFQIYIHWLYFGTLPIDGRGEQALPFLAKAYVLGEELIDSKFKNDVLDTIIATAIDAGHCPIGEPVAIIYDGTPPSSPARRLMVDFCASMGDNCPSWKDQFENCPKDFLVDAMKAMVIKRVGDKRQPWGEDSRPYHESEEGGHGRKQFSFDM